MRLRFAQVAFFRWEDVPWDTLAFPTTSWALWHHRQVTVRTEQREGGDCGTPSLGDVRDETREGVALRRHERLSDGGGVRVSTGAVFSAPAANMACFWCPERGLHLKDGWNSYADS